MVESANPDPEELGSPVGRRVFLGLVAAAGVGVVLGSRITSAVASLTAKDPTGLSALLPGAARFRIYSVVGSVPVTPSAQYRLRISGAVSRPLTMSLAELAALSQTELVRDVQCVTGWRVPAVAWGGVLLRDVLTHVGADTSAAGVTLGSADGVYTETLSMAQALRDDVLVATSMQGAVISHDHGGPVRLYVAPMYFYKSLKWLDSITVSRELEPGYWEERGYDVDAWVGKSNGRSDAPTS